MFSMCHLLYNFFLNLLFLANDNYDLFIFYNKYKVIEFYYYVYANFYYIYKILKSFFVLGHFNMLKLYVIFINDSTFFKINNFLIILLFKFKKFIKAEWKYMNKGYFKLNKKYKNYYKFEIIRAFNMFLFLILFMLFILIWKNRTAYFKGALFVYPLLFYVFTLYMCHLILSLFYYKIIGFICIVTFIFLLFSLKWLN